MTVTRVVTLAPPCVAVTSTVLVKLEYGVLLFANLTYVLVPLVPPVVNVLLPDTKLKLQVTLRLADTFTVAVAVPVLKTRAL